MPSLLQKLSFYDPELGRHFVVAEDGFYWKQGKKTPQESKVTHLMTQYGWELKSGNDVWLIFKRRGSRGELTVIRGSKKWFYDLPNSDLFDVEAEGVGLESLQQALDSGKLGAPRAKAMNAGAATTSVNNAGNGHDSVGCEEIDDLTGKTAGTTMYHGGADVTNNVLDRRKSQYGAIFVTPDVNYAKNYIKTNNGGLYAVDIGDRKIFDPENEEHLEQLQQGYLNLVPDQYSDEDAAMSDYSHIVSSDMMDWSIGADAMDAVESLGFGGMRFRERPGNISRGENGYEITGDPIESVALFDQTIPARRIASMKQGREIMHDDSGARTGLRNRPDYDEFDSFCNTMNRENSKGAAVIVLDGKGKTGSVETPAKLYVTGATFIGMELDKFTFSPSASKAKVFQRNTASHLAKQIFAKFGTVAKLAGPAGLLTTQNTKTQKQPRKELLTQNNEKTQKGEGKGYLTGIMHLAPSDLSGAGNVCPCASPECRAMCLNTAGTWTNSPAVQNARRVKTELYFNDREKFMEDMRKSIKSLIRKAEKQDLIPAIRINGTSDLPQLAQTMAREFPTVQFYDYTKIPRPWERQLKNYHITFSRSEVNEKHAMDALQNGINVCVVFNTKKGDPLPKEWKGYKVIDGDLHDLRFLDMYEEEAADGRPLIVGIRGKGKARGKGREDGFVIDVKPLDQKPGNPDLVQIAPMQASGERRTPQVQWYTEGVFDDAHLSVRD